MKAIFIPFKNQFDRDNERFLNEIKDIEVLKEIHYLSHNKGVRLANVSKKVSRNPVPADARVYLIHQLREFKDKLLKLKEQLE